VPDAAHVDQRRAPAAARATRSFTPAWINENSIASNHAAQIARVEPSSSLDRSRYAALNDAAIG